MGQHTNTPASPVYGWLRRVGGVAAVALIGCLWAGCNSDNFIPQPPLSVVRKVFTGSGVAAVNTAINAFRDAIGGANNGASGPALTSGRREVNWDAVTFDGTDFGGATTVIKAGKVVGIPVNRFQGRGVTFDRVTAVANDGFQSVNAGVLNSFTAFSPFNIFSPFGTNTYTVNFVKASAPTTAPVAAKTTAFGAVFLNVRVDGESSIEFFNGASSVAKFFAPVTAPGEPSFVGVQFNGNLISSAVVRSGTAAIFDFSGGVITSGPADAGGKLTPNLVAFDDFIYAEPQ